MSAYRGHLTTVVGDGPEVVIKLSGQWVRVLTPDGNVHTWPSDEVRVTGISGDRFWLAFDGEIAVFAPEEPEAFMLEFLPGLKAARTVADAIAAARPPPLLPGDDERETWTPDHGPRVARVADEAERITDAEVADEPSVTETVIEEAPARPRPHVPALKPRLPQLAEHVEAHLNGISAINGDLGPTPDPWWPDEASDCEHAWEDTDRDMRTCSSCGLRELRRAPASALQGSEDIHIDLTDAAMSALPDAHDEAAGGADEPNAESALLRDLASRHQAFQAGRRGTYQPRR